MLYRSMTGASCKDLYRPRSDCFTVTGFHRNPFQTFDKNQIQYLSVSDAEEESPWASRSSFLATLRGVALKVNY